MANVVPFYEVTDRQVYNGFVTNSVQNFRAVGGDITCRGKLCTVPTLLSVQDFYTTFSTVKDEEYNLIKKFLMASHSSRKFGLQSLYVCMKNPNPTLLFCAVMLPKMNVVVFIGKLMAHLT